MTVEFSNLLLFSKNFQIRIEPLRPDETTKNYGYETFNVTGYAIRLERKVTSYIMQFYMPTGMFVIVSSYFFLAVFLTVWLVLGQLD